MRGANKIETGNSLTMAEIKAKRPVKKSILASSGREFPGCVRSLTPPAVEKPRDGSNANGTCTRERPTDSELLDRLSTICTPIPIDTKHNYCDDCERPMELTISEYRCPQCGFVKPNENGGAAPRGEVTSPSIRIMTGRNKGKFHNVGNNYPLTQRKTIHAQLMQCAKTYKGLPFPPGVLQAATMQYNHIQQTCPSDKLDADGNVTGQQKFVKRSNPKDEILAGLIYFEGIRAHCPRKRRDVAEFMNLHVNGFSRGEDILRTLEAQGKISIPVDDEPTEGFTDRYLEMLRIDSPERNRFVVDIVNRAEQCHIGLTSQLSSKIVGAIWLLIVKCKLPITAQQVEKHTDNTKRNTFVKFYRAVLEEIGSFEDIFAACGVPK